MLSDVLIPLLDLNAADPIEDYLAARGPDNEPMPRLLLVIDEFAMLAKDFPDVKFEHATGYKTAENLRTYDSRTYEGAYMAGVIAGKMTKSNTLGVVGSIPIPDIRGYHDARYVAPNIVVGFGRIGQAVAARAKPFNLTIVAADCR